jgi:hypothetical protein
MVYKFRRQKNLHTENVKMAHYKNKIHQQDYLNSAKETEQQWRT